MAKLKSTAREHRRVRNYLHVKPSDRRLPNSIRRLIFSWITEKCSRDCIEGAAVLNNAPTQPGLKRRYQGPGLSGERLYGITRNKPANYSDLDAFSRQHRVPMPLVLLFTRIYSEIENPERRSLNRARRTIDSFRFALNELEKLAANFDDTESIDDQFGYQQFLEVCEKYIGHYDDDEMWF